MKKYKVTHQVTINGVRKVFRGQSEREVRQKILAYEQEQKEGKLFADVAEEWAEKHFGHLSPTTHAGYNAAMNRAVKAFGECKISEISPQSVDAQIKYVASLGRARKTVANDLLVMRLIFDHAILRGYITFNPCSAVRVPYTLPKSEREELTVEEQQRVIASKDFEPFGLLGFFLMLTGLRLGEALALEYGDIDFEKGKISISKTLYWDGNRPKIKDRPKTVSSVREAELLPQLAAELKKAKLRGVIFGVNGEYLSHRQYINRWNAYQKHTGITKTAHCFRHTYATMCYDAGVDVKEAQRLLGHAQASTTMNIYTHITQSRISSASEKLQAYLLKNAASTHKVHTAP